MKIERIQADYFSQGASLTVKEMAEDGFAELALLLPQNGLLLQYNSNIQFIFKNRKRADGIVFFPDNKGVWVVLLVELKKTVTPKNWDAIKLQWHGAWLHAIALAAVLDIKLSGQVEVMAGYRQHKMGSNMTDPILLKSGGSVFNADCDWHAAKVQLPEVGHVTLHRCQLDAQGYGSFALI